MGAVSIPSPVLTRTRRTRASWVLCPPSLLPRQQLPSVLVLHIPSTPCVDDCRCSLKSLWKSTSTRAPWIVSRRLQQRRGLPRVCSRGSLQILSAVLAVPSSSYCTIARRCTLASEATDRCAVYIS